MALPFGAVSVVFDEDMLADSATDPASVLNPANYSLTGLNQGPITIDGVTYNAANRTTVLTFDAPAPDSYALTVNAAVENLQAMPMVQKYTVHFSAIADFTANVVIHFSNGRADLNDQTYLYDVTLTNETGYDLLTPVVLTIDSLGPAGAELEGSLGQQTAGAWWIDVSSSIPNGRFLAGQTPATLTVTFKDPSGAKLSFHSGVLAMPTVNLAPTISSAPVTAATVGQPYTYQIKASDSNGAALSYLLYSGPAGMTVDPQSGLVSWMPAVSSPAAATVVLEVYNSRGAHAQQQFTIATAGVNAAPVFDPLNATISGLEGQWLELTLSATDPQGLPLVYWADHLPPGAVFDATQQALDLDARGGAGGNLHRRDLLRQRRHQPVERVDHAADRPGRRAADARPPHGSYDPRWRIGLHPLAGDRSAGRGAHLFQRLPAGRGHARSGHGRFPMDAELHRTGCLRHPLHRQQRRRRDHTNDDHHGAGGRRRAGVRRARALAGRRGAGRAVPRLRIRSEQPQLLAARSPARRQLDPA